MRLLVTGATGKVGQAFLPAFLAERRFSDWGVVALCNNRMLAPNPRVSVMKGSVADPKAVASALEGVTHVLHLAAVKETPDQAIDVALKGLYLLLDGFSRSPVRRQFMLLSGDCVVGHIFHGYSEPITEQSPRRAYRGVYALTKVLEETMLEQVGIQEDLKWTILRAPWIMEKDDFRYAFELGEDQFGGPSWSSLIAADELAILKEQRGVPAMRDAGGDYLKRSFIHVDDLVKAMLAALDNPVAFGELFNVAMDRPVDYGDVADLLEASGNRQRRDVTTSFHSNWLDNSKARMVLGWQPEIDLKRLVERAWSYRRAANDPRIVWYPG
ncbi:NAD-dependent epimerase/dehydratase [Rhizobium sp. PDO1-076]|uniref:NAD-dependent epimerase/dehydratase family protein n=1 Tax=Rhizobium sp. PDO1-076 TaxID=1125979 RepID=UPI00024E2370|nr:NAD(P)-dependent oxidoreductase [Rhizobium sp. PDO1-076]EHS53171.1 NAD-dependent epimerase/dehydratase [Rhizobium sp. PDO1-076]